MHHHRWLIVIVLAFAMTASALAQEVTFDPMLMAGAATRVVVHDGWVYTGYRGGGLVAWSAADPTTQRHFTPREGLGGIDVSDLLWTGRNLWVATLDGGVSRLTDPGASAPSVRVFASNPASLAVTALSGAIVGQTERVYYGTAADGIGVITDGLPGGSYTTADGLLDDRIVSLALAGDALYVATPAGVARFADNVFTTINTGLDVTVNRLAIDAQGRALAATNSGLRRWDEDLGLWVTVAGGGSAFIDISVNGADVWMVRVDGMPMVFRDGTLQFAGAPTPLPDAAMRVAVVGAASDEVWIAGRYRPGDMQTGSTVAGFAWVGGRRAGVWEQWFRDGSIVGDADGVAFDTLGRAWVGERNGDGLSGLSPQGTWTHITNLATADNDSSGLFNQFGGVLSIVTDASGALWFCQFYAGVIRVRGGDFDLIYPANSAIAGSAVVRLAAHPSGPIFVMTDDGVPDSGVQVLVDPNNWRRDDAWVTPDVGGNTVWAALAERPDVIWFIVGGVGLVRWDVNGVGGPADPLTWADLADDRMQTFTSIEGSTVNPSGANALALGADGTIWVAANGVIGFTYDESFGFQNVREFRQKESAANEGLLSNVVVGVAVDRNAHLWALTSAGLNRICLDTSPLRIDAFTDFASFLSLSGSGLYSGNIIEALPGGTYRQLAADATGEQLVVSSDRGAVRLTVAAVASGIVGDDPLAGVYLYPNPFSGRDGDTKLRLGGVSVGDDGTARATVEILNLQGQIVYRLNSLDPTQPESELGFFEGAKTRTSARVAAGLYVVKVQYRGATAVRTLAVVN
jgi:ligand-binding sensor domain-containing protein